MDSAHVTSTIDLARIRANAAEIRARTGVEVWATIKADAYGLGAARVAAALADVASGFCLFALDEAEEIGLRRLTGRGAITLGPVLDRTDPARWVAAGVRPAVATAEQARALRAARPVVCVDTGMQRFACPAADVPAVVEAGAIDEAFTHATRIAHVRQLEDLLGAARRAGRMKLHAAASSMLDEPAAWLDAVRPGLAVYAGAARVAARLVEVRESGGPVGYTGWASETGRHGVIVAGYSNGLRPGPAVVNGRRQRVPEVGMQTAYVTLGPGDRVGDEVVLLGDGLTEAEAAAAWGASAQQALMYLVRCGARAYRE